MSYKLKFRTRLEITRYTLQQQDKDIVNALFVTKKKEEKNIEELGLLFYVHRAKYN